MNDPLETMMQWTAIIHGMGWLAVILISFFFTVGGWILTALALMFGAKIVRIEDRSFGKALVSVVLIFIPGTIITSILTLIHPFLGIIGLILPILFVQWVYNCSLGKAFFAYIISLFASVIFYFGMIIAIMLGFSAIFKNLPKPDDSSDKKTESHSNSSSIDSTHEDTEIDNKTSDE